METNIDIKLKDHFKLYVLLKDKIIFESELHNNGIAFYSNLKEQPIIDEGIRYFLLNSDRQKIDKIIIHTKIIASTETILINNYRDEKKAMKLYFYVALTIVGLIVLILIVEKMFFN